MQVAMRQFKAGVSNYLSLAQQGHAIEITSHKRPVARIVGLPKITTDSSTKNLALINHAAITWNGGKPRAAAPVTLSAQGMSLSEMVIQDR